MNIVGKQPARRTGMTLVELVLATVLAAMLMATVLGVLNSLTRQRDLLIGRRPPRAWQSALADQLTRDMWNSRRIAVGPQTLRLAGYAGRDFDSGQATHRPTEITYYVVNDGTQTWLLRREVHLDELSNDNWQTELVCQGVARLEVEHVQQDGGRRRLASAGGAAAFRRIPSRLNILMFDGKTDRPIFEQRIILH